MPHCLFLELTPIRPESRTSLEDFREGRNYRRQLPAFKNGMRGDRATSLDDPRRSCKDRRTATLNKPDHHTWVARLILALTLFKRQKRLRGLARHLATIYYLCEVVFRRSWVQRVWKASQWRSAQQIQANPWLIIATPGQGSGSRSKQFHQGNHSTVSLPNFAACHQRQNDKN